MGIYVVVRENDYFRRGTFVEDIDEIHVQAVTMEKDESGQLAPYVNYGLLVPREKVRKAMMKLMKRGIDEVGLKG